MPAYARCHEVPRAIQGSSQVVSPFDLLAQIQTFLRPKVSQSRADTAGPAPDAGIGQWVSLGSGPGQAGEGWHGAGTAQA